MFFSAIVMLAAKRCKVKVCVTHSHAIKWNRKENVLFKIYRSVMRFIINHCATDKVACSYDAGCYLYGEKEYKRNGKFISNGIKTSKYEFNVNERNSKRRELKISDDEILVGHIGTLYYIKNQTFLIEIFAKMLETNPKMKLVLVGEDVDGDVVRKKAAELGVESNMLFLGLRNDIPQLLFAMDIFIFPSLFEALPVSLIEAQATKLPCLISDTVTSDVKFNDNVEFLSITDDSSEKWAEKAFELVSLERNSVSTQKLKDVYDISSSVKELDKIYSS